MDRLEGNFRRNLRIVVILFLLSFPVVGLVGSVLAKLFGSFLPFLIFGAAWMATLIIFCIHTMLAYYRWKDQSSSE